MIKYFTVLFLLIFSESFAQINTPNASPSASVSQQIGLGNVSVTYSRPSLKGRKIFGNLVPFNKVWRTGANKCTNIKFDADMELNGRNVKAGNYALFTIPRQKTWKVMLNSDDKQWGAYDYDSTKNVLTFEVPATKTAKTLEQMTIFFRSINTTKCEIIIAWENFEVPLVIEQCVDEQIMAEIKAKTSDPNVKTVTLEQAAEYYYQNDINMSQALQWAQKVLLTEQKYWNYQLVASIAAKMNKCDIAIPNAQKSLELAKIEKDDAYILLNKNVLAKCLKK